MPPDAAPPRLGTGASVKLPQGRQPGYSIDLAVDPDLASEQLAGLCGGRQRATEWLADVLEALR